MMKSDYSNINVPQLMGTVAPAVNKGVKRKWKRETKVYEDKLKGEEEIYTIPKDAYGLFKKSLFSSSTKEEIEKANFSAKDRLFIEQQKMQRIVNYIDAVKMQEEDKKCPFFLKTDAVERNYVSAIDDNKILNDYFENHKSCTDGKSCGSETCAEITDLLRCWKSCEMNINLDCDRCHLALQGVLWKKNQIDLRKKMVQEPFEKLLELIENYDGFQGMKLYNDLRRKNLFTTSDVYDLENCTQEEKNMIKLLKIFRFLHYKRCVMRRWVKNCDYPDCATIKQLIKHVDRCNDESACTNINCREIKNLMSHWKICLDKKTSDCPICGIFPQKYEDFQEKVKKIQCDIGQEIINSHKSIQATKHDDPLKIKSFYSKY